jgi:rubrerythrin
MEKTMKNLTEAFSGESQANRKYLAFAKKADDEGYKGIAKLFRAVAEAETVHAHNHLREMGAIQSTTENLLSSIKGETYEFSSMYPPMIEDAKTEGFLGAQKTFQFANEVEKIHANLFRHSLDNMQQEKVVDYYVCGICGNTVENEPKESCGICGTKKELFKKID